MLELNDIIDMVLMASWILQYNYGAGFIVLTDVCQEVSVQVIVVYLNSKVSDKLGGKNDDLELVRLFCDNSQGDDPGCLTLARYPTPGKDLHSTPRKPSSSYLSLDLVSYITHPLLSPVIPRAGSRRR